MSSKKSDPLASALSMEKKAVATYAKMEDAAKKKNALKVAALFDQLGRDSEKRVEKIQKMILQMKKEKKKIK
ncbi:MAG: hypothetical protein ACUVXA_15095 [Candidatus Jordarchaeum sp.]|uniref:hypothetical protein n=1 Tax=Candidatus Jordarchaeum sp. TaxID=2823881 RepID=UPI0040495EA3